MKMAVWCIAVLCGVLSSQNKIAQPYLQFFEVDHLHLSANVVLCHGLFLYLDGLGSVRSYADNRDGTLKSLFQIIDVVLEGLGEL